jgi:hypothetical protein
MAGDEMFAPLAAGNGAAASADGAGRAKPAPIVPVPVDAPECAWRHPKHGAPVMMRPYHDADGRLVGFTARVEYDGADGKRAKDVLPIAYCRIEQGGGHRHAWRARALPAPRPLYRLPELVADPMASVIVTEGEKKADAVTALFPGHVGTTSMGGARAAKLSDWAPLAGRRLIIWPDHDQPGRRYADHVAGLATATGAASVSIVAVPADWPEGWDIADALPPGAAPGPLAELLQSATPWAPSASVDDAAEIARLKALHPFAYDRERGDAAKRLGCRISTLDRLVAEQRGEAATIDTGGRGRPLEITNVEPWPEPVDGATLLDELEHAIRRHVVLDQTAADAAALWIVHSHAIDVAYVSPRLAITSPEMRCGKTTLLTVLSPLVARPLPAANMTKATMFRAIEAARPTLLIDEADSFVGDDDELRGIINAGHCRATAKVLRTVETPDGYEVREFAVWGPIVLAAIGHLPDTIDDRSIKIAMRRRRPDASIERLRLDRIEQYRPLAQRAARWATDHLNALRAADPAVPGELHDRAADNWRPLFAIADAIGGTWPERARKAATELSGESDDQGSMRVALLTDIRAAFAAKAVDRLASEDLVAYLASLDERPWPEYRGGKPITKTQIARLLAPLRISPGTIRLPDGRTAKGYYRRAFDDAFAQYLPAENVTTPQPQDFRGFAPDFEASQANGCDVSELAEIPSASAACDAVTFPEPRSDDDEFEERAAIREFDAGYARTDAERLARAEANPPRGPAPERRRR